MESNIFPGAQSDVAAAIAWLTSDDGSWVTGQTITVNGGYVSSCPKGSPAPFMLAVEMP